MILSKGLTTNLTAIEGELGMAMSHKIIVLSSEPPIINRNERKFSMDLLNADKLCE